MTVIKAGKVPRLSRGGGVETIPLITWRSAEERNKVTTGISIYPQGTGTPLHLHNCDEQMTLLEGVGEVEIAGRVVQLEPMTLPMWRPESSTPFAIPATRP